MKRIIVMTTAMSLAVAACVQGSEQGNDATDVAAEVDAVVTGDTETDPGSDTTDTGSDPGTDTPVDIAVDNGPGDTVDAADARKEAAEERLKFAKRSFDRVQKLFGNDATTEDDLDRAELSGPALILLGLAPRQAAEAVETVKEEIAL